MIKVIKIRKSQNIPITTKLTLVESLVFSVSLYASKRWILKEADKTLQVICGISLFEVKPSFGALAHFFSGL